jgi:Ca-activated chloride channel family protein
MTFILPSMLAGLLLIPIIVGLYIYLVRARRKQLARQGNFGIPSDAAGRQTGAPLRHLPWIMFLVGLAGLLVAMARPQAAVSLPRIEGTVILAFDVSGSMGANDIQPTRIDAAKEAAKAFVEHQPSTVQIGIVAFSDTGFSVQAPSYDQQSILAAINRLAPQRGTSVANGILVSLNAIQTAEHPGTSLYSNLTPAPTVEPTPVPVGTHDSAVIVLLSDGENNERPDPVAAAQAAANRGVRIYTVGLGSPAGIDLHVNGLTVHTQLDEPMLKQIAQVSGGTYYNAQSAQQLINIYNNLDPALTVKPEETELTAVFAGASAVFLLIGGLYSLLQFGRVL